MAAASSGPKPAIAGKGAQLSSYNRDTAKGTPAKRFNVKKGSDRPRN